MRNKAVLQTVCQDIRNGKSLYAACQSAGCTSADFYRVLAKNSEAREEYFLALADYADACTDDIKTIVDDLKHGVIDNPTAKLLIDTEKWLVQRFTSEDMTLKNDRLAQALPHEAKTEIVVKFI